MSLILTDNQGPIEKSLFSLPERDIMLFEAFFEVALIPIEACGMRQLPPVVHAQSIRLSYTA